MVELTKSVDPKLTINKHLGVLPTGITTKWIASSEVSVSWVSLRNTEQQTPTNLTVDRCSVQSQAFECLNCTHTLLLFLLVMLFRATGTYLNQACSGFESESPVHFRTLTWKVSNTFSSISHSSLPFIFFFFGGRDTGRESTIQFVLVSATESPSAAMCSLLTIWKIVLSINAYFSVADTTLLNN